METWVSKETDNPIFSLSEGIRIQQEHLLELKSILLPEVYIQLKDWAEEHNFKATCGHEVIRGQSLWDKLHEWAIKSV